MSAAKQEKKRKGPAGGSDSADSAKDKSASGPAKKKSKKVADDHDTSPAEAAAVAASNASTASAKGDAAERKKAKFTFQLDDDLLAKVQQREKDLAAYTADAPFTDATAEEASAVDSIGTGAAGIEEAKSALAAADFLAGIRKFKEEKAKLADYPRGPNNGEEHAFTHQEVEIRVRLDKEKAKAIKKPPVEAQQQAEEEQPKRGAKKKSKKESKMAEAGQAATEKFYPRVRVGEQKKDAKTVDLAAQLKGKTPAYIDSFMNALQNKERTGLEKKRGTTEYTAYSDGVGVRVTALVSDTFDYPGSSAITELMLARATADTYPQLFIGDEREGSYGALPSQNQNPKHEKSTERIKVFKEVGEFLSTGTHRTSAAKSNTPTLRKMRAMATHLPADAITVNYQSRVMNLADFDSHVKVQTIRDRHAAAKKDHPKHQVFSDPEDDIEKEAKKYEGQGAEYDAHLDEMIEQLQLKKAARQHARAAAAANNSAPVAAGIAAAATKLPAAAASHDNILPPTASAPAKMVKPRVSPAAGGSDNSRRAMAHLSSNAAPPPSRSTAASQLPSWGSRGIARQQTATAAAADVDKASAITPHTPSSQ
jgi:hypothetical protein